MTPDRIGYSPAEVARMLPLTAKQVSDAVRKGRIPCIRKPDGTRLVPYVIPAEWVEQARRTPTGPTAA